jgi:predicted Zn finger-like uncharacterized protein
MYVVARSQIAPGPLSLYTQCSQCETIFKLSAGVLSAAGGQVRCGRCGEVFDALARLAEEPSGFTVGDSTLDLEARADQILQSIDHLPTDVAADEYDALATTGEEIASLEIQDLRVDESLLGDPNEPESPEEADRSLEFTLPPGGLDRIFIAENPAEPFPAEAEGEFANATGESAAEPAAIDPEVLDGTAAAALTVAPPEDQSRRRHAPWATAGAVLALLLAGQIVHHNREWLATRAPLGGALRSLYATLGNPLRTPVDLSGYQLRQWGVTGEPTANGALRLRASILNTTNQMQPYPLLRVTLADRFGARIGARDFEPAEYSGKPMTRLMTPGEVADATVDILDPGKNAEGFEIDVCLRGNERKVTCANDLAMQPR